MHKILANSENPIIFYIYLPRMGAERARKSRVSKNIYMKFLEIGEAKTGAHSRISKAWDDENLEFNHSADAHGQGWAIILRSFTVYFVLAIIFSQPSHLSIFL